MIPIYILAFVVVHEIGHTVLARLLGDPDSVFYLVKIEPGKSYCLGCNISDHTKISPLGNFIVALGGLLFTQSIALIALFLLPRVTMRTLLNRLLSAIALGFAFLDVPVQAIQGLMYDLEHHTWPTNVDLMDAMLLVTRWTGAPQPLLKAILAVLAAGYLYFFWQTYRRTQNQAMASQTQPAIL